MSENENIRRTGVNTNLQPTEEKTEDNVKDTRQVNIDNTNGNINTNVNTSINTNINSNGNNNITGNMTPNMGMNMNNNNNNNNMMMNASCNIQDNKNRYEMQEKLLKEIQNYKFAITDLALFLDTHPNDLKAICLHKKYCNQLRILQDEYLKKFGPLNIYSPCNKWRWLEEPWPWEGSDK